MPVPPIPEDRQDGTTIRAAHVNQIAAGVNDLQQQINDLPPGGYSAYELWLQDGNSGTVEDFLASLRSNEPGPPGDQGDPGISPEVSAIEELPEAAEVDGSELVPVAQEGVTSKASLDAIIDALALLQAGGTAEGATTLSFGLTDVRVGTPVATISGFDVAGIAVHNSGSDHPSLVAGISVFGRGLWLGDGTEPPVMVITHQATGRVAFSATPSAGFGFAGSQEVSIGGGFINMTQRADPAAPPANQARLFHRVEGGKGELCVRFPTGAVQVIATEP